MQKFHVKFFVGGVFYLSLFFRFLVVHGHVERCVENQLRNEILQSVDERREVFVFLDFVDFQAFEHKFEKRFAFLFVEWELVAQALTIREDFRKVIDTFNFAFERISLEKFCDFFGISFKRQQRLISFNGICVQQRIDFVILFIIILFTPLIDQIH